jgi:xanthine dehydrogenase/oxidase
LYKFSRLAAFVEKGTFEIGGQYPLYMENLSCIVVPTEDGYDVHSSTQWMDLDQIVVARTVGVPVNK